MRKTKNPNEFFIQKRKKKTVMSKSGYSSKRLNGK
jgi:hypothetical protein